MRVKVLTVLTLAIALFLSACGKSDADLTKAATDKLAADKVAGLTVTVKDGVATLSGEAADVTVKTKAETSVKGVEGIKSVDSSKVTLKPLPPAPAPAGPDKMLEGTINENLKKAGLNDVTATVTDGNVTLNGSVTGKEGMARAMQAASSVNPKHIENKIEIKK